MTAGTFFALMALFGWFLISVSRKKVTRSKGKSALTTVGITILAVSLFGLFTALI